MELAEALTTIALLEGHIAALETQVAERDARLRALTFELSLRDFELQRLRQKLYGHRDERVARDELVLPGLQLAAQNDGPPPEPPPTTRRVRAHDRKVRRRPKLAVDPARCTQQVVDVHPDTTDCACCGDPMRRIGEDRSTVTERIPARYHQTITVRHRYACGRCKRGVVTAPPQDPPPTGPGGVGVGLAVDVAVMHYADHLPFHRLAGIFGREGLTIDRSTLSRVAARVAGALAVVVEVMRQELLAGDGVVGIDGTHVKILAKGHCRRRVIYVLHGAGHVVFRAHRSERADDILEGFKGFEGVVVCDAAKVHLGAVSRAHGLLVALCNAHGRRYFFDARGTDTARANHALALYQEVARVEQACRELDPEARQRRRAHELGPRFEAFHQWLLEERPTLLPRSPMAEAFDYALRHWSGLTRFLRDGRLPWTNNASERLLRHLVVGRKAWVFRGSFEGAALGCVLWSLTMSCRLHGLDPRQYLLDTLAALTHTPRSRVGELTPRAYAARQRAAVASERAA